MANPEKDVRPDAKLKNLPEEELQFLWELRYKEDGKIRNKLTRVQAEVPLRYGFTISSGSLSEFYVWLKAKREWQETVNVAEQAKNEFLTQYPNASSDELLRVGQLHFPAISLKKGDNKGFVAILKAITARERVIADREKAEFARQSKVEAGLAAMLEEIKGKPSALKAFNQLKEALGK